MQTGKYVAISTKVSPEAFNALQVVEKKTGVKRYVFLQTILDAVLKVLFTGDYKNRKVQEVVLTFFDFLKAQNSLCLSSPSFGQYGVEASSALVLVKSKKEKPLPEIVHVQKIDDEHLVMNRNEDKVLTEFLQAFSPSLLVKLEHLKEQTNANTLTATLKQAVSDALPEEQTLTQEIQSLFEDCRRYDFGQEEDFQAYRRTARNSMDTFDLIENRKELRAASTKTVPLEEIEEDPEFEI